MCYMWIHTANTEKEIKIEKLNRKRKKKYQWIVELLTREKYK